MPEVEETGRLLSFKIKKYYIKQTAVFDVVSYKDGLKTVL